MDGDPNVLDAGAVVVPNGVAAPNPVEAGAPNVEVLWKGEAAGVDPNTAEAPPPKGEVAPPKGLLIPPKPPVVVPNPPNAPGDVLLFALPKAPSVPGEVDPKAPSVPEPPNPVPGPVLVAVLNPDPKGPEAPPVWAPKTGFVFAPRPGLAHV